MNAIRLIPVYFSALILSAHFFRNALYPLVVLCLLLPFLLFIKKPWVARLLQLFLLLGAAEWFRALYLMVSERQENNMPWMRLAIIIGVVALFTAASALLFQLKSLKNRYSL